MDVLGDPRAFPVQSGGAFQSGDESLFLASFLFVIFFLPLLFEQSHLLLQNHELLKLLAFLLSVQVVLKVPTFEHLSLSLDSEVQLLFLVDFGECLVPSLKLLFQLVFDALSPSSLKFLPLVVRLVLVSLVLFLLLEDMLFLKMLKFLRVLLLVLHRLDVSVKYFHLLRRLKA